MNTLSRNKTLALFWVKAALAFALIFAFLLLGGCTGSKSLSKKAAKLEEAGLYSDAAQFYYNSLLRNNSNIDARIGLVKTGQRVLNDKVDDFTKARSMGETKQAVYSYLEAMAFHDKVEKLGIKLEYPAYITDDYEEVKKTYIRKLYDEGNTLMADKKFDLAKEKFKEIERLQPGYKDIAELKNVATNEPLYLSATAHFDNRKYRLAYYELDEIYKADPDYRDVAILRNECLDLGKFPLAVLPFENASGKRGVDKAVNAFVVTQLSSINDPFLKIVERENMDLILKEQRMNLSGMVDENTAAEVGNLLGAKAILTGTVLSYNPVAGTMQASEKKGFEAYRVKLYNKAEDKHYYQTRYKPVSYNEYYNQNKVSISFQYKVISLETGEVLFSNVSEKSISHDVYYATYGGEATQLFPAGPEGALTSRRDQNRLLGLLRADRNLKSVETLTNEVYSAVAEDISRELVKLMHSE